MRQPLPLLAAVAAFVLGGLTDPALAQGSDDSYGRPAVGSVDDTPSDNFIGRWLTGAEDEDAAASDKSGENAIPARLTRKEMQAKRPRTLAILRGSDHGLVANDKLQKYVNEVMQEVMDAAGYSDLPVQVHILATPEFRAAAYPDGSIYVSIGMLWDLKYEDELAFLLSHELSHVLLRHYESDWLEDFENKVFVSANLLGSFADKFGELTGKTEAAEKIRKVSRIAKIAYEVTDNALSPAWTREQEASADEMGVDLMIKAGFDGSAVDLVMDLFDDEEKRRKAAYAEARRQAELAAQEDASKETNVWNAAMSVFGNGLGWAVKDLKNEFGNNYYQIDKRRLAVIQHFEKKYPNYSPERDSKLLPWRLNEDEFLKSDQVAIVLDHYEKAYKASKEMELGNFEKAEILLREAIKAPTKRDAFVRYVFYQLRSEQKQERYADLNLKYAKEGKEVSYPIFEALIDRALEKNDYKLALDHVSDAQSRLGDPPRLLPKRIRIYAQLGNAKEMQALLLQCQYDFPNLATKCKKAAGEASDSHSMKQKMLKKAIN